jgi:hypothetical protein
VLGTKPKSVEGINFKGRDFKPKVVYDETRLRTVIDVGKQPGGFELKLR